MDAISVLTGDPLVFTALATMLGLLVGSFLNVVIHRLPRMLQRDWRAQCAVLLEQAPDPVESRYNLIVPRSACPHCGHVIGALENIPVISYLLLKGRCGACGEPISVRYPIVELMTGVLSGIVAWSFGAQWATCFALMITWALIALTFIDVDHQLLPDIITLPLLWLGLLVSLANLQVGGSPLFADVRSAVIGAAAGYLSLWLVFHLFRLLTGKEGMGYGDFKLLAALGAWLGWQMLLLIILLSTLVGALIGIVMMLGGKRSRQTPIPFGPYLAAAGWIAMLWGDGIVQAYLRIWG